MSDPEADPRLPGFTLNGSGEQQTIGEVVAKESMLQNIVETRPPADAGMYAYPDAALVIEFKNDGNRLHLILGSGDASDAPGSLYANAPNGSVYIPLTATAGNMKLFIKFGLKGKTDGAWKSTAALT